MRRACCFALVLGSALLSASAPALAQPASTPVRHIYTYHVRTKGRVWADVKEFAKVVAATYADPRGWRRAGVAFERVPRSRWSNFDVVLANASTLPSFSSGCSSLYSCRVGRNVVINQTRWLKGVPFYRSLANYRNEVVNHETGHWLGLGHRFCTRRGGLAPVMQQQSKGLQGCQANPWPLLAEIRAVASMRAYRAISAQRQDQVAAEG